MAISPQEVKAVLSHKDKAVLYKLEARIDQALKDRYDGGGVFYYSAELLEGCTPRLRTELLQRYMEAGWQVSCVSDQRDGDFLEFRMPDQ